MELWHPNSGDVSICVDLHRRHAGAGYPIKDQLPGGKRPIDRIKKLIGLETFSYFFSIILD